MSEQEYRIVGQGKMLASERGRLRRIEEATEIFERDAKEALEDFYKRHSLREIATAMGWHHGRLATLMSDLGIQRRKGNQSRSG